MKKKKRRMKPDPRQASFSSIRQDAAWGSSTPPRPKVETPELTPRVQAQIDEFEVTLVAHGIVRPSTADCYKWAMQQNAKHAGRARGRPLRDLSEIYERKILKVVLVDDIPLNPTVTPQLRRTTMRHGRAALRIYLRAVGVPDISFEAGQRLIDSCLQAVSERRGYRRVLPAGGPSQRDSYIPPAEDVRRFLATATTSTHAFTGPRLAAAAALTLWHGLRPVSVLSIDGQDFREHLGRLILEVREKACQGKRERRELELRPPAVYYLDRYVTAYNNYRARRGEPSRIGFGVTGLFFRAIEGPWQDYALRQAFKRCCGEASIAPFTSYSLRRLHASGLADVLPVDEAARAGGWRESRIFLQHYARSMRVWEPRLPMAEPQMDLGDDLPEAKTA